VLWLGTTEPPGKAKPSARKELHRSMEQATKKKALRPDKTFLPDEFRKAVDRWTKFNQSYTNSNIIMPELVTKLTSIFDLSK
jgi:ribosomal protein RSM22 (predicted rRNA methylase)